MKIEFIRWGNLNPVKHKEARLEDDDERRTFHTAPKVKGFYAFPMHKIEPFLLGGTYGEKRCNYLKDENGDKIRVEDFWEGKHIKTKYKLLLKQKGIKFNQVKVVYHEKDKTSYIMFEPVRHKFFYTGPLWHHLEHCVNSKDILDRKGSWIKTNYDVYCQAYKASDVQERFYSYIWFYSNKSGNPHTCPNKCSKDHYEVFIERI